MEEFNNKFLADLKDESCKLIKLSNDIKLLLNKNNRINTQENLKDLNDVLDNTAFKANENKNPSNGLETDKVSLLMLYNNYKLLLKKYNELNEEKMSYVEGLKEYRSRLDNSNHLLRLQRNIILSNQKYNTSSFKQLEVDLRNKELQLRSLESELKNKEQQLHSLESELQARELDLNNKQFELEKRQSDLETSESNLEIRESELRTKELELKEKELQLNSLLANNAAVDFSNRSSTPLSSDDSDLFPSNSMESQQASPSSQLNEPSKTLHDTNAVGKVEVPEVNSSEREPNRVRSTDKLDVVNNDIINSLYIKNLNMNDDDMFKIRKSKLTNKVSYKPCKLNMNNKNELVLDDKDKLHLKNILKIEFGYNSLSYELYNNSPSKDMPIFPWNFLTIYIDNNKNLHLYINNENTMKIWYSYLNYLLFKFKNGVEQDIDLLYHNYLINKFKMKLRYLCKTNNLSIYQLYYNSIQKTLKLQ